LQISRFRVKDLGAIIGVLFSDVSVAAMILLIKAVFQCTVCFLVHVVSTV